MPRRSGPVDRGHRLGLDITPVSPVIASAVTQVNPADKGTVHVLASRMAKHDELLVVRTAGTHPHIQQADPTGLVDFLSEMAILPFRELKAVQVRAPDQATHEDTPFCGLTEKRSDFGAIAVELLIWVTAPVREKQQVSSLHGAYGGHEGREVLGAVYEGPHVVA